VSTTTHANTNDNDNAPLVDRGDGGGGGGGGGGMSSFVNCIARVTPNMIAAGFVLVFYILMLAADGFAIWHWFIDMTAFCERRLAMWLLVMGVAQIILIVFFIIIFALLISFVGLEKHSNASTEFGVLVSLVALGACWLCLSIFTFCWLIVGSVWVYPDTGIPKTGHQCPDRLYVFSFWFVTAQWIAIGVCGIYNIVVSVIRLRKD